jgi:hypothetical protein
MPPQIVNEKLVATPRTRRRWVFTPYILAIVAIFFVPKELVDDFVLLVAVAVIAAIDLIVSLFRRDWASATKLLILVATPILVPLVFFGGWAVLCQVVGGGFCAV